MVSNSYASSLTLPCAVSWRDWQTREELHGFRLSFLPRRGPDNCCPKSDASSSAFPVPSARSASSPARSLSRASWGTLQPHPFRSEKAVSRNPRSRPCSSGLKCLYPGGKQPSDPTDSDRGGGGVEPDMTPSRLLSCTMAVAYAGGKHGRGDE